MTIETRVLRHLLGNRGKELSIRQIAQATKTDYKNTYLAIQRLERAKAVSVEMFGHSKRIGLGTGLSAKLMQAEMERRDAILANKNIAVMLNQLKRDLTSSLYVLLLFGSYAKGTQGKGSDIDLMFIVPDGKANGFEKAVHASLSILPLPVHPLLFTESQFRQMLFSGEQNVGKEAAACNIILHNIESYYRVVAHDR